MPSSATRTLDELSPTEFENLGFDLLQSAGMINLVWRTPGSDGGRDLEGIFPAWDLSGHLDNQKWYIECKRHQKSIDWPTIWEKIAFSDAGVADFLLVFTNSNPSPQCETEIQRWNTSKRHPKVRIWRGYDLLRILQQYPTVAIKYRLFSHEEEPAGFLPLVLECTKIIQGAYVAFELGNDGKPGLEAAAAVCELLASRMSDLAVYGRPVYAPPDRIEGTYYPWMTIAGDVGKFNDTSLRAFSSVLKYVTGSAGISMRADAYNFQIEAIKNKLPLIPSACRLLREIAVWANWEIDVLDVEAARVLVRGRENDE